MPAFCGFIYMNEDICTINVCRKGTYWCVQILQNVIKEVFEASS